MYYNDFGIKVDLYDPGWPLSLHNVDILEKDFKISQKKMILKFYDLKWPLMTSEVILHFIKKYFSVMLTLLRSFYQNRFINKCARKKVNLGFSRVFLWDIERLINTIYIFDSDLFLYTRKIKSSKTNVKNPFLSTKSPFKFVIECCEFLFNGIELSKT